MEINQQFVEKRAEKREKLTCFGDRNKQAILLYLTSKITGASKNRQLLLFVIINNNKILL